MANEIDIISDKDLQAPLALAKNYEQLANTFDDVVTSTTKLNRSLENGATSTKQQRDASTQLVKAQKDLDKANDKAAKSQLQYAQATEFADKATGGMIGNVKALGKQFYVLLANPIGPFLLLIAGALASVGAYFKTTNEGADKFDKIMAALGGVVNFFTNKIAALGEQIVKMFEDGNALGSVFKAIFDQVINRIAGAIDSFTSLLKIINILSQYDLKDIFTGNLKPEDLQALKTAAIDMGKGFISTLTGIGTAADELGAKIQSLSSLTESADKLGDNIRDRILSKAQALLDIEKQLFIFKDKANHSDAERVKALQTAIGISEKNLQIDIDLATRKERLFTAELLHRTGIITSETEANRVLERGTTLLQDQILEQKALDDELEERRKLQADIINLQTSFFSENKKNIAQLGALQKEIDEAAIARAQKEVDIRVKLFDEQMAAAKEISGQEILGLKSSLGMQEDLTKNFNQRLVDDAKKRADAEKQIEKDKTDFLKEEIEKRRELEAILFTAAAVAQTVVMGFTEQRKASLDEEAKRSEDRRTKELAGAEGDERKKLAINRKFDREQAKIKTKQAQADKQAAIFNILISTAMGIARVAPNPILIALVAAIGAAQAAFVVSKSLPKYWMGTTHSAKDFIAGDRGRELVQHNGSSMIADKPTMFTNMLGATVHNKRDTDEILGTSADVGYALRYGTRIKQTMSNSSIVADRLYESNKLLKKIANKGETSLVIDSEGFHLYSDKVMRHNNRINKRFRGR